MTGKQLGRGVLAGIMAGAGVLHFARPAFFIMIVPDYLPSPELLVLVSGVAEVAGGVGLLVPRLRKAASWGLIVLYIAVLPANLNMALHSDKFSEFPAAALWLRLPLQLVLIYWALRAGSD